MYSHPLLVAHNQGVVSQRVADPHQANQQQHAVNKQPESGDVEGSPVIKAVVGCAINSVVDLVSNIYELVEGDEGHPDVADDSGDLPDFVVLGQCLVISAKHLSHFKVPVGEQEVRILVAAVTNCTANLNSEKHIFIPFWTDLCWVIWAFWIECII